MGPAEGPCGSNARQANAQRALRAYRLPDDDVGPGRVAGVTRRVRGIYGEASSELDPSRVRRRRRPEVTEHNGTTRSRCASTASLRAGTQIRRSDRLAGEGPASGADVGEYCSVKVHPHVLVPRKGQCSSPGPPHGGRHPLHLASAPIEFDQKPRAGPSPGIQSTRRCHPPEHRHGLRDHRRLRGPRHYRRSRRSIPEPLSGPRGSAHTKRASVVACLPVWIAATW